MTAPTASTAPAGPKLNTQWARGTVVALLVWTLTTGLIDALSFLHLHNVFVANMTGNVVFLGFLIAGHGNVPLTTVLAAMAGFLAGGFGGGYLTRSGRTAAGKIRTAACCQVVTILIATIPIALDTDVVHPWLPAGLLAIGFGLQNSVARHLGAPDLTTTVLTMTLTGISADRTHWRRFGRRLGTVALMCTGAVLGTLVLFHIGAVAVLLLTAALTLVVAVAAGRGRPAELAL